MKSVKSISSTEQGMQGFWSVEQKGADPYGTSSFLVSHSTDIQDEITINVRNFNGTDDTSLDTRII